MSWIIFALGAALTGGLADFFRKLGSGLKDPLWANVVFQAGALFAALFLFLLFSRKFDNNNQFMIYAFTAGIFISIFTAFSFKALMTGPGVSTAMPIMRLGAIIVVVVLGIFLLREKLTWNIIVGISLASVGVYLLYLN